MTRKPAKRSRAARAIVAASAACLFAPGVASIGGAELGAARAAAPVSVGSPRLKPPAPGPQYITRADLERIGVLRDELERRQFKRARATADRVAAPIAKSLALWYYHYAADPKARFHDIAAFLAAHPDWPARSRIQRHAEKRMPSTTPPEDVIAFFDQADPITADGQLALARALFAAGRRDAGVLHVRDAWVNGRFTLSQERTFLSLYGVHLTPEDHAARVDRLLWSFQVTNARRVFARLAPDERRRAQARANLIVRAPTGAAAFDRMSASDRADPGVLLAAVRYYRRTGEEPRAIALARSAPNDPQQLRNPARWWDERQLLMRWALKNGLYTDAYAMAAEHGLEPGNTDFSEAEFNAGWMALSYLGEPRRASAHFAALTASVATPISLSRGYYWLGRAAEAARDSLKADFYFNEAAAHPYSYYGQLAAERLGGEAAAVAFDEPPEPSPEERALFGARPTAQALRMLSEIGDQRAFLIFGYHLDDRLESRGEYRQFANLALDVGAPHVAVRAGKAGVYSGVFAPDVLYPQIYVPAEASRFAPPEMILGLSRQESEFNPRAYSRAGARGVMQLIPSTAELTARKERLPYRREALLGDANYNMMIGSAHLSHLLADFDGSYPMVFAAYNAGKHRVRQWIVEHGDPRDPDVDPIEWVERIPFSETRNYVQRVLENIQVYRSQLSGTPLAGALARDLERGGSSGRVGTGRIAGLAVGSEGAGVASAIALPSIAPRIAAIAAPYLHPQTNSPHGDATLPSIAAAAPPSASAGDATEGDAVPPPASARERRRARRAARELIQAAPHKADVGRPSFDEISASGAPAAQAEAGADGLRPGDDTLDQRIAAPDSEPTTASVDDVAPELRRPQSTTVQRAAPSPAPAATASRETRGSVEQTRAADAPAAAPVSPPPGQRQEEQDLESQDQGTPPPAGTGFDPSQVAQDTPTAATNPPALGALAPSVPAAGREKCLGYGAYIAQVEQEEASAADLNAGSLAELRSGGPDCAAVE